MWKSKAMVVLQTMDFDMINTVENGQHVPKFQPMVNNTPFGPLKQKPTTSHADKGQSLINLDVKSREAI